MNNEETRFLKEERFCIQNENNIATEKDKQYTAFILYDKGYTREEVSKKMKISIKLAEKYFDDWAFI